MYMALIFRSKCTLRCHLQFISILTSLKFCHLVNEDSPEGHVWPSTHVDSHEDI